MPISKKEARRISLQLRDYVEGSAIEKLAGGFVEEINGEFGELKLVDPENEALTIYPSKRYLNERGLDEGAHNLCMLVEYSTPSGHRLELVRKPNLE